MIKVRYLGKETYSLRTNKIYDAELSEKHPEMVIVFDESKEWYAFPIRLFEIVE